MWHIGSRLSRCRVYPVEGAVVVVPLIISGIDGAIARVDLAGNLISPANSHSATTSAAACKTARSPLSSSVSAN